MATGSDPGAEAGDSLAAGARLGHYEILRRLAIGGMAEIYLARAEGIEGFEKIVVLKRVLPQYARDEEARKLLLDEARLAATLDHPNVAQVYDIGEERGEAFFTMEYVRGADLVEITSAARAQGAGLELGHALAIIAGVAAGLHHAHEQRDAAGNPLGIVHRDVSPANVLVTADGVVKVVDFGIAKAASTRRPPTRAGETRGKTAYMSPEQCRGLALDRRSDVFAIGLLLYELTTGAGPFQGTDYEILHRLVTEDAPPPSARVPGYPPALEAIVAKALARRPDDRYATALDLQLAIEELARRDGLDLAPHALARLMERLFGAERWRAIEAAPPHAARAPARRRRARALGAAAAGLAIALVGGVAALAPGGRLPRALRGIVGAPAACVAGIAIGRKHACAWTPDGDALCWGRNVEGQLGDGAPGDRPRLAPVRVRVAPGGEPLAGIDAVAAGAEFSCARRRDGTVLCWGDNRLGQIGAGTTAPIEPLAQLVRERNGKAYDLATDLFAGIEHACAQRGGGAIMCWGNNARRALGRGGPRNLALGVRRDPAGPHFARGTAGFGFTCAIMADSTVRCWGTGEEGGGGASGHGDGPVTIREAGGAPLAGVVDVHARRGHACAVLRDTTVRCWGDGSAGELGTGLFQDSETATTVVASPGGPPLRGVRAVRAGWAHTCALLAEGTVLCWGQNDFGQLGTGRAREHSPTPVPVVTGPSGARLRDVRALGVGSFAACASRTDGTVLCWGQNDFGQLGTGDTRDRDVATAIEVGCW
jgi:alpha-tubulin suppressor-like RCC1 family protein/tRNA A-37 threonylcarbamoyl transferase component Bud32